ncbi:MAG: hypothetical protein ACYDA4_01460 [Ignavibacteriaceae bacterium]
MFTSCCPGLVKYAKL